MSWVPKYGIEEQEETSKDMEYNFIRRSARKGYVMWRGQKE